VADVHITVSRKIGVPLVTRSRPGLRRDLGGDCDRRDRLPTGSSARRVPGDQPQHVVAQAYRLLETTVMW